MNKIKITFCSIMLNNEPFTRYLLRQIYPFAYQIIVVEGATPFSKHVAREDGHSSDGTLEELKRFKEDEDAENKLTIVTAEDEGHADGFWPGEKEEMCSAFARRATGDWLWQVDGDEFYSRDALEKTCSFLISNPQVEVVSFRQIAVWGSLDYRVDGPFMRGHRTGGEFTRLFKWGPGFTYAAHRPPTVCDAKGHPLGLKHWVHAEEVEKQGVRLMHYSLLFPHKVRERNQYYVSRKVPTRERDVEWGEQCWLRLGDPFRVHNVADEPAWLERYDGEHPEQIVEMWGCLEASRQTTDCRLQTVDPSPPNYAVASHRPEERKRLEDRWRGEDSIPQTTDCRPGDGECLTTKHAKYTKGVGVDVRPKEGEAKIGRVSAESGSASGRNLPLPNGEEIAESSDNGIENLQVSGFKFQVSGRIAIRDMADVEALMRSWRFRMCRAILRMWPPEEWCKYRGGYRVHQMFYCMARTFSKWCGSEAWGGDKRV